MNVQLKIMNTGRSALMAHFRIICGPSQKQSAFDWYNIKHKTYLLRSVNQRWWLVDTVRQLLAAVNCLTAGAMLLRRKHRRRCNHRARRHIGLINGAGQRNGNAAKRRCWQTMSTVMVVVVTIWWIVVRADSNGGIRSAEELARCGDVSVCARWGVTAWNQLDAGGTARRRVCPRCHWDMSGCCHGRRTAHWDTLRASQQGKRRVRLCRMRCRHVLQLHIRIMFQTSSSAIAERPRCRVG